MHFDSCHITIPKLSCCMQCLLSPHTAYNVMNRCGSPTQLHASTANWTVHVARHSLLRMSQVSRWPNSILSTLAWQAPVCNIIIINPGVLNFLLPNICTARTQYSVLNLS